MSFKGTTALVELQPAPGWDPRAGDTIERRWRGTPDAVAIGAAELKAARIRYRIEPDIEGGYKTLIGWYGAEETQDPSAPLADTWSLVGNDLEKSIWTHPYIPTVMQGMSYDETITRLGYLRQLRAATEAFVRGDTTFTTENGESADLTAQYLMDSAALLSIDPSWFSSFICSLMFGVEAYQVSQWVLRRSTIISASSTIRPAVANVGRLLTTPQLIGSEGVPSTILFDIPMTGYWLKRTPTCEQTSSDKWTITQEWWHADDYDRLLYELAT